MADLISLRKTADLAHKFYILHAQRNTPRDPEEAAIARVAYDDAKEKWLDAELRYDDARRNPHQPPREGGE